MRLNGLDLFSGIGGISLALRPWVRTICYVEIERYCQAVLASRMGEGCLDVAPIWDDVRSLDGKSWRGVVDIIAGGFPCQDISTAGRGAGLEGERSGLFFEIIRLASEIRPRFIFLENVPAIIVDGRGGWDAVGELAALRYDCRWGLLSAADVGAAHERDRWWCLAADNDQIRCDTGRAEQPLSRAWSCGAARTNGDFDSPGFPDAGGGETSTPCGGIGTLSGAAWRNIEPVLGGSLHGVSHRVDRIAGLGNSVVPQAAREAFRRLIGIK